MNTIATETETLAKDFSIMIGRGDYPEGEETRENVPGQDPPGVMNGVQDEDVASEEAQAVLSPYRTTGRSIEDVDVNTVQHFTTLPDYIDPMDSEHPYLVRTPRGLFCIDGWEIIEQAIAQGEDVVACEIETIGSHSIAELILRKMASRSRTRGGRCLYPEIIRNTKNAAETLMSLDENLIFFAHGGRRYGEGFSGERDNNVRQILSTRLGKDRDTINTHLLHGQYITSETCDILNARRVKKDFFEKYHRNRKRRLQGQLEEERLPITEIPTRISADILAFLDEYEQGPNEEASEQRERSAERQEQPAPQNVVVTSEAAEEDDGEADDGDVQETECIREPDIDDRAEVSMPTLRESLREAAKRLEEAANDENETEQLIDILRQELLNLQRILNGLNSFRMGYR
jgi:hypothetical protein